MSIIEERAKKAEERTRALSERLKKAKTLKNEGKSNADIAKELGISEQWVRQLLKRSEPGAKITRTADDIAADLEARGRQLLETASILRGKKKP